MADCSVTEFIRKVPSSEEIRRRLTADGSRPQFNLVCRNCGHDEFDEDEDRLKCCEPSAGRRKRGCGSMSTAFARTAFNTSRLLDFCDEKQLTAQTGHSRDEWPLVACKELLDNSLDACEEAGVSPQITITVNADGIAVAPPEKVVQGPGGREMWSGGNDDAEINRAIEALMVGNSTHPKNPGTTVSCDRVN